VRTQGWTGARGWEYYLDGVYIWTSVPIQPLVWHSGRLHALWKEEAATHIKVLDWEELLMMFFSYSLAAATLPALQRRLSSGELLQTVPIDLPVGVMMHDFAITEHYTLLWICL